MPNFLDDYEPVDARIYRFWEKYPDGRIVTHLEEIKVDDQGRTLNVVFRAEVYKTVEAARPDATGYAEESAATSTAPKGSIVETGETSAIGRALATLGFSPKGARPSREEMQKAERHRDDDAQPRYADNRGSGGSHAASEKSIATLRDMMKERNLDGLIPADLTAAEAKSAFDYIKKHRALPARFTLDVADDYQDEEPF